MSEYSKKDCVEELAKRTHLSESLLEKFSDGDLKTFFGNSASPDIIQGTFAGFSCLTLATLLNVTSGTSSLLLSVATGVLALAAGHRCLVLKTKNETLTKHISARATGISPD